jgi:NAD(P)-dependent dehydrogenase (short-subunit alcohol dehydrogenase family)
MTDGDRVCVITGAAAGLGREMAGRFASEGYAVIQVDRNEGSLGKAVEEIRAEGGATEGRVVDVSDEDGVRDLANWIEERHGHVDVLVNNAGIALIEGSVVDMSRKAWDLTLAVNLTGTFLMCRHIVPLMPDGASIVNVATVGVHRAVPGTDAYLAAKAGVVGLTKAMAVSLADRGIRVNAVSPGTITTDEVAGRLDDPRVQAMIERARPLGEFGRPSELAAVVYFLCSPEARYVNGTIIPVDGGATA